MINKYYWDKPSTMKMNTLLNSKGKKLFNLCKFINAVLNEFNK